MTISVIIPTYNRRRLLLEGLRSLQAQTLPEFEIVVADNAASSEAEKLVKELNRTTSLCVRYVPEPQLGLHHARHAGGAGRDRAVTGLYR